MTDALELDVPATITVDRHSRRLVLDWGDGRRVAELPFAVLRSQCPCSSCRRMGRSPPVPADFAMIDVVSIQSMGYGLQLVFSDGHERGIYPWTLLARIRRDADQIMRNG